MEKALITNEIIKERFGTDYKDPDLSALRRKLSQTIKKLLSLSLSLSLSHYKSTMEFSVFPLLILLLLPLFCVPVSSEYYYPTCDSGYYNTFDGNYTANSTYQSNLNLLFSVLESNATGTGFAAATVGSVPNQVSGLVLCRGDVNGSACASCINKTLLDIVNLCPYYKSATLWYDSCYAHFSNQHFLTSLDNNPQVPLENGSNVTASDVARLDTLVHQLMLKMEAWALNNSTKYFATGQITNFSKEYSDIYGFVQCTPDLNKTKCQSCLDDLVEQMNAGGFSGEIGARILGIFCNVRYETHSYYEGEPMVLIDGSAPAPSPPAVPLKNDGKKKKNGTGTTIAITVPILAALLSLFGFCICIYKKKKKTEQNARKRFISDELCLEHIESVDSLLIDFSTLKTATINFNESNKLGEGGFGAVYKGILPNGEEIAVKRLSKDSGQGIGELKNELVLVAKLQHKNLVRVLGVSLEEHEKLLVYEYVPNGSLDMILFDPFKKGELDWLKRLKIINGIARGLQYLHEDSQLKIVHRDLKASNILLDKDMNPKIADFGLARLFPVDRTVDVTKRVVGTFGYMAPEYAMHGLFSIKSDVFSFGVLLLEIITGKRNSGSFDLDQSEDLLSSTWDNWTNGTILETIDPLIDCPTSEIIRHMHIGLLCVQEDHSDRPRMSEVVIMLSDNDTISLQAPSKPAFYLRRNNGNSSVSSYFMNSVPLSRNDMSISEFEPR
ncbi:hypothetical protein LUZ60_010684 [Juncus effusus]|nr:hypothetical protein LUZ60_010684 [Juncus effusus]